MNGCVIAISNNDIGGFNEDVSELRSVQNLQFNILSEQLQRWNSGHLFYSDRSNEEIYENHSGVYRHYADIEYIS